MKRFLLAALPALLLCSTTASAQTDLSHLQAPAIILHGDPSSFEFKEESFWQEDFANGIPNTWTNTEQSGIASWEYRGPSTNPDNSVGSRGSCFFNNEPGSDAIQSESQDNGYVIFDSNWWDDPNGPCGNQGSGPAPAPHLAALESPSVDLSAYSNVGIVFTQYIKNYDSNTRVEVKVDGGSWTEVWANDLVIQEITEPDDVQRINISPQAAGHSDVRFRFVFEGTYYFWMIDDVKFVELETNNMHAMWSTYGDFDFVDPDHPTGFELMEYGQYPDEMAPLLKFTTWASNYGAAVQTEVNLTATVHHVENGTDLYTGSSTETFNVQPNGEVELRAGQFQMPETIGHYDVFFAVSQNESEESPEDNGDTLSFRVTDNTYARDKGPVEAAYVPLDANEGMPFEVGNVFVITSSGISAYSISVGAVNGSVLPATLYGAIYEIEIDKTVTMTLVATTQFTELMADLLNGLDDDLVLAMPFSSPVPLQNGHAYLVVAGCEAGHEHMLTGVNGDSPDLTTWRKYGDGDWGYLTSTVVVRLNTGTFVGVAENPVSSASGVYPNPADSRMTLSSDSKISEVTIWSAIGEKMHVPFLQGSSSQSVDLNVEELADGCYVVRWVENERPLCRRFIIRH